MKKTVIMTLLVIGLAAFPPCAQAKIKLGDFIKIKSNDEYTKKKPLTPQQKLKAQDKSLRSLRKAKANYEKTIEKCSKNIMALQSGITDDNRAKSEKSIKKDEAKIAVYEKKIIALDKKIAKMEVKLQKMMDKEEVRQQKLFEKEMANLEKRKLKQQERLMKRQ